MNKRDINYYQSDPKGSGSGFSGTILRAWRYRFFWVCVGLALLVVAAMGGVLGVSCGNGNAAATTSEVTVASVTTTLATLLPTTTTTLPVTTTSTLPPTTTTTLPVTTTSTLPPTTTTTIYTHAIASPARIVIPAIKCDAKIVYVGIDRNGAMEVPDVKHAGWYELGPAPGASGPSVIIAHVSYSGTHGPFYSLKNIKPGDKILVYDKNGDYATFQVDSKETTLKTRLPTEKIWNNTQEPVIRLVTCGGKYDPTTRHYLSNIIVYGHLVQ